MLTIRLASLLCLALAPVALFMIQGQDAQDGEPKKPYQVGTRITEEIVLEDLEGKPHSLFESSFLDEEGELLTLVFWSLRDPQCQAYRKQYEEYEKEFAAKGVTLYFVASSYDEIFSGHTDPIEKFREFVKKEKFTLPILIDRDNRIADDFGALTANHAFVIDRRRHLRYAGGIDDDPKNKHPKSVQYFLKLATETLLTGQQPKDSITRPTGRKIKRAPKKDGE